MLDFEMEVGAFFLTIQVCYVFSGGDPVQISDWEIRNPDFPVQMKHTISPKSLLLTMYICNAELINIFILTKGENDCVM